MEEDEKMWDLDDEATFMDRFSSSPGNGNASASMPSHPLDFTLLNDESMTMAVVVAVYVSSTMVAPSSSLLSIGDTMRYNHW